MEKPKTLIVIAGSTAVGKTAVAIALAKHFKTEIISADSRQCYQEMSIGTATPDAEELNAIKHHFINSHSVTVSLTAANYEKLALQYADEIFQHNDSAIVCGGTGLYVKAICEGLDDMPPVHPEIIQKLNLEWEKKGLIWLQEALSMADPLFYENVDQHNPQRLLRALAFRKSTGKSITEFQTGVKKDRDFNILKIGLELPRPELYECINARVDTMMECGLLEEVKSLTQYKDLKNLNTVGYKELFDFLAGKFTLEQAIALIRQNSRHYAKRQMTWFKKDKSFHWFSPKETGELRAYIEAHL